jgi:diaminopimelate decarboxylase/aspartate kinase
MRVRHPALCRAQARPRARCATCFFALHKDNGRSAFLRKSRPMSSPTAATPNATAPSWVVLKFGGTSVSTRARWDKIAAIAHAWRERGRHVLIVVSALSGITDQLKALADAGDDAGRAALRDAIVARHRSMFAELGLGDHAPLHYWLERLAALVANRRAEAHALAWQAELLALGELMSSTLGVSYLRERGLAAHWLDAREPLQAQALPNQNAWGRYLSASVPAAPDAALPAALAARGALFITQGFIARNAAGETVVLGRGGSDTSASYFGALLRAEKVEIWTDVAGMFSANPRQVPNARLLARLDYEEAQEIATTGAKVLHPRCINPVREARVPMAIRDTNHPDMAGTEIGASAADAAPSIKAISSRSGITLISMESIGMWQQVGFLADVFEFFKRHGLSIDLVGTSETNVTVSLDPTENLVDTDVLSVLCTDLAKVCRVKVIAPCAAITLVGRGMRSMLHRLSALLAEFGPQRVHLISQSSNNLNLTFVVDEAVAADLVPRLHELLIKAEAMRVEDGAVFGPSWRDLYAAQAGGRTAPWWIARRVELLALAGSGTPRYVYDLATVRARPGPEWVRARCNGSCHGTAGGPGCGRPLVLCDQGERTSARAGRDRRTGLRPRVRVAGRARAGGADRGGCRRAVVVHAQFCGPQRVCAGLCRRCDGHPRQPAPAGALGRRFPRPRDHRAPRPRRRPRPSRQGQDRRRAVEVRPRPRRTGRVPATCRAP